VIVQVLDAENRLVPTADDKITFGVQGAERILGVDNRQPDSHESYHGPMRKVFSGLALAILQPTAGSMTLSASSASLAPAQIEIKVG
jgi:beta-galactosidase